MSRIGPRVFLLRLLDLVFRNRREARLAAEIQDHLDALTEQYATSGMSDAEARLAARRAFGGVDQIKILSAISRSGLPSALMSPIATHPGE